MTVSTSEVSNRLAKLGRALREVTRLVKTIGSLEKNPTENVYRIEKLVQQVQRLIASVAIDDESKAMIDDWLSGCIGRLQAERDELPRTFGLRLEALLKEQGIELKGRYPLLQAGLYTIEVDFGKPQARVWYGPRQELMGTTKPSPSEVAKQVQRANKDLTGRPFSEEDFLRRLYDAYRHTLSKMGRKDGDHAPILEVLVEYVFLAQDRKFRTDPKREHFREYGRAFFSYDLHRLQQKRWSGKELSLVVATRADTTRREGFLWVPTNDRGDGTTYAYLYFREVA